MTKMKQILDKDNKKNKNQDRKKGKRKDRQPEKETIHLQKKLKHNEAKLKPSSGWRIPMTEKIRYLQPDTKHESSYLRSFKRVNATIHLTFG